MDSGASNSVLDRALAQQLGLKRAGRQELTSGIFREIEWLRLNSLKVAGRETGPTQMLGLSLAQGQMGRSFPGILGILGYDFLADYIVQIDYPRARLRLIPPTVFQPQPDDIPIDCQRQGPGLSLAVSISGRKAQFTLDTGSGDGVLVQHLEDQESLVPASYRGFYDASGIAFGSGKAGSWPGRGDIQVGPFLWTQAPLTVVNESSAEGASLRSQGNIGVAFLRHFRGDP